MEDGFGQWPYVVALVERGGVATRLTGFTIDGDTQNITSWSSTSLPAYGTIYARLFGADLKTPLNRNFVFTGKDASGPTWPQRASIPFASGSQTPRAPGIALTTSTPVVTPNFEGPASCPWAEQVTLHETGGFLTLLGLPPLTGMTVNRSAYSAQQIQQIFGTTRLAPYESLPETLCFTGEGPTTVKLTGITDSSQLALPVTASVTATLADPANSPSAFTSPSPNMTASLSADTAGNVQPAAVPVGFSGGSPDWTATVAPANAAGSWLTVSPLRKRLGNHSHLGIGGRLIAGSLHRLPLPRFHGN